MVVPAARFVVVFSENRSDMSACIAFCHQFAAMLLGSTAQLPGNQDCVGLRKTEIDSSHLIESASTSALNGGFSSEIGTGFSIWFSLHGA